MSGTQEGIAVPNSFGELDALIDRMVSIDFNSGAGEVNFVVDGPNAPIPDIALIKGALNLVRIDPNLSIEHADGLATPPKSTRDGKVFIGLAAARTAAVGLEIIYDRADESGRQVPHADQTRVLQMVLAHTVNRINNTPESNPGAV